MSIVQEQQEFLAFDAEVILDECRVPNRWKHEWRINVMKRGMTLNVLTGAVAVGIARRAFEEAIAYAQTRYKGGALIITADHGNADDMGEWDKKTNALKRDENGSIVPKTAHSVNPVVFHLILPQIDRQRFGSANVENPGLGNVAATICTLLGFAPPESYLPPLVRPR